MKYIDLKCYAEDLRKVKGKGKDIDYQTIYDIVQANLRANGGKATNMVLALAAKGLMEEDQEILKNIARFSETQDFDILPHNKKRRLEQYQKLLIVVDMVNGFVREGAMADPKIAAIIPEIERLIQEFKTADQAVSFIKDTHELGCREFQRYPVHCVRGTTEADLVAELLPYEQDNLWIYEKNSTNARESQQMMSDLSKMVSLEEIVITGCCTDICVMNLALSLQNHFDQQNRDIIITVPENAVETYDSATHSRDYYQQAAFCFMKQGGIQLVKKYGGKNYEK